MSIVTDKNRKWWGLAALMPPLAMVFVDQSVLPVALPTIQKNLGASSNELEWTVNSYLLVTAVLVIAGGKVGDRIGHRRAFAFGMFLFALASGLCGFSPDIFALILARALQGMGSALMIPASTALLMSLFPPSERGKASGINVSASAVFIIIGPLIGGYLTEAFSWRWIFWINLPIAVLGLLLVYLFIPKSPAGEQKFDFLGFLFFTISCSGLVVLLMQGAIWGWSSFFTLGLLALSIISGFYLFRRGKKTPHPFLDLTLFHHPIFKAVNISIFATQFILMITVFRAIFFQDVLGWTPLQTGLITVVTSVPVLFMSTVGGILSDKYSPKLPISMGFLLLIFSFFWLSFFAQGSFPLFMIGLFAMGFGVPLIFTPSYASAMSSIPPKKAGIAFGTIATVRSIGASIGVAVLASFIDNVQNYSFRSLVLENPDTQHLSPSLVEKLASGHLPITDAHLSSSIVPVVSDYLKEAKAAGFIYSHLALAFVLILAFSFVFVLYHRRSKHHLPETPAEGWD